MYLSVLRKEGHDIESKLFGKPRIVGVDRRKKEEGTLSSLCTASVANDEMTGCRRLQHCFAIFHFRNKRTLYIIVKRSLSLELAMHMA